MLEPREADIPVLFLVFVVLPLVAYIWLGKWSEGAKKRERVSLLAHLAAQEALRAESMAATAATVVPLVSSSNNAHRECARCFSPATTRCSRCKSVRYCSGKCQIMHWRQGHKKVCLMEESFHDGALLDCSVSSQFFGYNSKPTVIEKVPLDNATHPFMSGGFAASTACLDIGTSQVSMLEKRTKEKRVARKSNREMPRRDDGIVFDSLEEISRPSKSTSIGSGERLCPEGNGHVVDETRISGVRRTSQVEGSNGDVNTRIMKMMGLRKPSKSSKIDVHDTHGNRHKRMKMLFPYEEFLKMFQCEIFNLMPRGLMNCGNSCYANAVMQCLTCTKPLTTFLLHRSHSRSCCVKGWCLMCELEKHIMMLREGVGPLSLSRILSHMQSTNCQIGNGSQEDAHEFLRLLVASMQSICLEELGGENKVDPRLQETTFIQHAFGGRLRSKVKCLGCHHESERYENIMDLTLEIYGWVESLEDALTQFTTPEDLDGENMYRCGRCAAYVRARKQLSIHEAPNVLTIVLKRFQEGRYGKINKYITFPDLLDMIPFMTGTDDMPPLYLLYAVVVHLDTLNASFSGHYVSYVKDMQGNWFRIDDTEVQQVPMSQVMSEGAYILFYKRSFPRPQRAFASKPNKQQSPARHCTVKASRPGQAKPSSDFVGSEPLRDKRPEFSDATSSDWSLFTSSDEASFTTESTRDSFSTVDYADACKDPISSIFSTDYDPQTRSVSEERGYVSSSYHRGDRLKQVGDSSTFDGSNYELLGRYGINPTKLSVDRTCSSHCKL